MEQIRPTLGLIWFKILWHLQHIYIDKNTDTDTDSHSDTDIDKDRDTYKHTHTFIDTLTDTDIKHLHVEDNFVKNVVNDLHC